MSEEPALLGRGLWFKAGPATLIVRPAGWYLLVPTAGAKIHDAAWEVMEDPPAAPELLPAVASAAGLSSADDLPAVLAALVDGSSATVIVKGDTPLGVFTAEGPEHLLPDGDEVLIREIPHAFRLTFGNLPKETSSGGLRMIEGAARVRGFSHMLVDPAELDDAARAALAEQVAEAGEHVESPDQRARRESVAKENAAKQARVQAEAKKAEAARQAARTSSTRPAPKPAQAEKPAGPSVFDDLFSGGAEAPATQPARDRHPEPEPAPAPEPLPDPPAPPASTGASTPEPTPAPAQTASTPEPAPAPAQTASTPARAPRGRRARLSSSLFDRRPAAQPEPMPQPEPAAEPVAPPHPVPQPQPAPEPVAPPEPAPVETSERAPGRTAEPARSPAPSDLAEETMIPPSEDEPAPAPAPSPAPAEPQPPGPARAGSAYDDLFGATVLRSVADAAVTPRDEQEEDEPALQPRGATEPKRSAEPPAPAAAPPAEDLALEQPDAAAARPHPSGPPVTPVVAPPAPSAQPPVTGPRPSQDFIDWVPGVGRPAPEVAQTAARRAAESASPLEHGSPFSVPEHSGAPAASPGVGPVSVGGAAPRRQQGTASPSVVMVPAQTCPNGHVSSPERITCIACGERLDGAITVIPRPPLGVVELSTGEHFALDRGAIIGRRPRVSRVTGSAVPQLITVPSPRQDISRSHLELRLEGWHVVARDLETTNGTTLLREGEPGRRLRPLEDTVLHDGDVLDLGDGVMVRWWENAS